MRYVPRTRALQRSFWSCAALLAGISLFASECAAQTTTPAAKPSDQQASAELSKNPELLAAFGKLMGRLQKELQYPPPRSESRLLPLLPESTVAYMAYSNYGETLRQALTIFQKEREENAALREWWQHGEMATQGPKLEAGLEKLYQLSQYVGDELVATGTMDGKDVKLLVVAEVRKPGLKAALEQFVKEIVEKSKPGVRILEPQELAAAEDKGTSKEFVVLVRPDYVVGALDLATLRKFNSRLDQAPRGFASAPFGQRVAQAYQGGVTVVLAADLQRLLTLLPITKEQDRIAFQRTGFADMKYAVWGHTTAAGQRVSQGELSFIGPRHGAASWLAAPAPLGSMDFVSPKAIAALSLVLKSPALILDDVRDIAAASNPNAFATLAQTEQAFQLSLKDDLLRLLSGEITLELDGVPPPALTWKGILQVNDPAHLQKTLSTLLGVMNLKPEQEDVGGDTYYTVRFTSGNKTTEIAYTFVDGYLVVASSRDTAAEAVRLHRAGESLGKSKKLVAALPPGHSTSASALFYEDAAAVAAAQMRLVSPQTTNSTAELTAESIPAVLCAYGEETAIQEAATSAAYDAGLILVVAAIAIPNLLRSRMAANEASAVGSLRSVNTAQVTYASMYGTRGFAPDLATLGPDPHAGAAPSADHADIIPPPLGDARCTADQWCTNSGYRFSLKASCIQQQCSRYVVIATPVSADTGTRNFCSVEDGVIRYNTEAPLTAPLSVVACRKWAPVP
jgi:type II secretory pathway pseudopilin PulG